MSIILSVVLIKKFIKLFYVRENLLLEYWLLGICKLLDGKLYKVMIMCEKGGKFDNIYSRIVFKYIICKIVEVWVYILYSFNYMEIKI